MERELLVMLEKCREYLNCKPNCVSYENCLFGCDCGLDEFYEKYKEILKEIKERK